MRFLAALLLSLFAGLGLVSTAQQKPAGRYDQQIEQDVNK